MAHRILVANDNGVLIRSLAFILEEVGYSVVPPQTAWKHWHILTRPPSFVC
jgi:CheY-like chemotaxis protein